jgi:DNA primase catalytic core
MARIADDELQRIKSQVKVDQLCREYGIELKAMGPDNLMGLCPFHDDREPSFGVTPSKNLWNCLAGCGGGDTIQLVMKKEGVSFRHAVEVLRQRLGIAPPPAPTLKTRSGTAHPVLVDPSQSATGIADHVLLKHVNDFYHQTFCNEVKAMRYLQERRCFTPEAAKVFQIGYANRTLGYRVPATTAAGKKLKEQLQRLGVLRQKTGHEHLTGSVVFPILDEHGNVAQMYGRKITPNLREGTPLHLYLAGEHRAVWNAAALRNQREWLLCESIIDGLTLWCAGFRNVTCAYGVNGFTDAHWKLIEEVRPQRIVNCYDNDDAGNPAAAKLAPELAAKGIIVVRAKLPAGKDINDVARENKNAQAALAIVLESTPRGSEPIIIDTPACAVDLEPSPADAPTSSLAAQTSAIEAEAAKEETPAPPAESTSPLAAVPTVAVAEAAKEKTPAPDSTPASANGHGDEATFTFGPRQWRVRGIGKNLSFETLRVQLRVLVQGSSEQYSYHLDTLDLCNAKHRQGFIAAAQGETRLDGDLLKRDLGQVLLKAEELQEKHIRQSVEPQKKEVAVADGEREAALALLRDPKLLDRILADFERCGVVGEEINKLVGYLAAVSRKLDEPLAVIIQSTSAAGKSSLMDAILAFVPEEQRIKYSAMTGQSLYYLSDADLQHKVLAVVEEEGAERASYALKLLQSEGELTIASTGKDPQTGRMVTQEYHVEGPVMIMLTTTAIDIDEELLNRCIVLSVDESREQTRRIHDLQREARTLDGVKRKLDKAAVLAVHRNAQRLLRPLRVVNPYARRLTFLDDRTRTRRDHEKYLTLIEAIALLHQYQRPLQRNGSKLDYIEVTLDDIAVANRIAGEALGRSLDELPPQTRRLLSLIDPWAGQECRRLKQLRTDLRFSRRDVREFIGWTDFQVRVHLDRLMQLEYVLAHRGRRGQCFVYELLYDGQGKSGKPFLIGLIDVEQLRSQKFEGSGDNFEGVNPKFEAPLRPQRGAVVPSSSIPEKAGSSRKKRALLAAGIPPVENARPGETPAPPPS